VKDRRAVGIPHQSGASQRRSTLISIRGFGDSPVLDRRQGTSEAATGVRRQHRTSEHLAYQAEVNQTDAEHGATVKRSGRGFVRARDYYKKRRETMNGFERLAGQRAGIHHSTAGRRLSDVSAGHSGRSPSSR
jgi:hypothetical protein